MFRFASSEFLNFELTRILTTAPFGGCEVAEFLEATALSSGAASNPEKWHSAWQAAGIRAEDIAKEAVASGDVYSARRARLRAANYFRASQYMMFAPDLETRIMPIYERSLANFDAALSLLDGVCHAERVSIPYPDPDTNKTWQLPGIIYVPLEDKRLHLGPEGTAPATVPVLVNTCGADSSQEEHFFCYPIAGVELGYAVFTFEGPGQGIVLRRHGLPFRPDWEVVTSAVLDKLSALAAERPEWALDTSRIGLAGASMGGYFALRGAADPRVKACVSVDPFYSLWEFASARLPGPVVTLWTNGWLPDTGLDAMARAARYVSPFQSRWEFEMSKWMFGVERPTEVFRRVMQFTFGGGPVKEVDGGKGPDEYLHRIKCPVLVTGAGQSLYFKVRTTTQRIYDRLVNVRPEDKEIWLPMEGGLGGLQAKIGAFGMAQMKTFAFLDQKFGIKRGAGGPKGSASSTS